MTSGVGTYSTVSDFRPRLLKILQEDLEIPNANYIAEVVCDGLRTEGATSRRAAEQLVRTGVRRRWNEVFADKRASQVAAAVKPFVTGHVYDLLAGDGTVAKALSRMHDGPITCWEREEAYPDVPVFPINPFSVIENTSAEVDTVLMSTVLHHEPDAEDLLRLASRLQAARWVIVENCISEHASAELHEFVDIFFNNCLNKFDVECTTSHRTLEQWVELVSKYGRVVTAQRLNRISGMPFPYELIVVDIDD